MHAPCAVVQQWGYNIVYRYGRLLVGALYLFSCTIHPYSWGCTRRERAECDTVWGKSV